MGWPGAVKLKEWLRAYGGKRAVKAVLAWWQHMCPRWLHASQMAGGRVQISGGLARVSEVHGEEGWKGGGCLVVPAAHEPRVSTWSQLARGGVAWVVVLWEAWHTRV